MPKPSAPAARHGPMLPLVMPPTGNSSVPAGNTARSALAAAGDAISAGNSLRPCAPAARAANASLGVSTPGRQTIPNRSARRTTTGSKLGATTSWPPAACTASTWVSVSTVPAPTSTSGWDCASSRMLSSAWGELSGTSRMAKPAAANAAPMAAACGGAIPRRIAISGSCRNAAANLAWFATSAVRSGSVDLFTGWQTPSCCGASGRRHQNPGSPARLRRWRSRRRGTRRRPWPNGPADCRKNNRRRRSRRVP